METVQELSQKIETCFREILETRMDGIPILNRALEVKCIGGQEWNGTYLFVLLTPWFMNILLVPIEPEDGARAVGAKRTVAFPAGRYEFISSHEDTLGSFWMCSLFSPVFEFADQDTALACAQSILDLLFEAEEQRSEQEAEMAAIWRREYPVSGKEGEAKEEPFPEAVQDAAMIADADDVDFPGHQPGSTSGADFSRRGFLTCRLDQEVRDVS